VNAKQPIAVNQAGANDFKFAFMVDSPFQPFHRYYRGSIAVRNVRQHLIVAETRKVRNDSTKLLSKSSELPVFFRFPEG
jgi:hypothetical protein